MSKNSDIGSSTPQLVEINTFMYSSDKYHPQTVSAKEKGDSSCPQMDEETSDSWDEDEENVESSTDFALNEFRESNENWWSDEWTIKYKKGEMEEIWEFKSDNREIKLKITILIDFIIKFEIKYIIMSTSHTVY